jgi:hypothetical protein
VINPVWRVEFRCSIGTLLMVNTLHVVETGAGPFVKTAVNVADEVNTDLQATYRAMLGSTYSLDEIFAVQIPAVYGGVGVPAAGSHPLGIGGARTLADTDLPPRICTMVQWLSATYGKHARGRFYCPPAESKATVVENIISGSSAYGTAVAAFAADVVDQGMAAPLKYCVYSPTRHAAGDDVPWYVITGSKWSQKLAYLSSRDR